MGGFAGGAAVAGGGCGVVIASRTMSGMKISRAYEQRATHHSLLFLFAMPTPLRRFVTPARPPQGTVVPPEFLAEKMILDSGGVW
jgi:hypothetical protein